MYTINETIDFLERTITEPIGQHWSERVFAMQKLGVLRFQVPTDEHPDRALHLWNRDLKDRSASDIHSHPFDFSSIVLAGRIVNTQYEAVGRFKGPYFGWVIRPGPNVTVTDRKQYALLLHDVDTIFAGSSYRMDASEIHHTAFEDGTVTVVTKRRGKLADEAMVFDRNEEWGNAAPEFATIYDRYWQVGEPTVRKCLDKLYSQLGKTSCDRGWSVVRHDGRRWVFDTWWTEQDEAVTRARRKGGRVINGGRKNAEAACLERNEGLL